MAVIGAGAVRTRRRRDAVCYGAAPRWGPDKGGASNYPRQGSVRVDERSRSVFSDTTTFLRAHEVETSSLVLWCVAAAAAAAVVTA